MVGDVMDLRNADEITQLKETIDRALSRVNTAIPGVVDAFDSATQTVTVIPAIQMRVNIDDEESFVTLPPIVNAPLIFPYAATAGFALTMPVRKGDPCVILFSQRALDNWHDMGGIQPPESGGVGCRHHDMTDALVMLAAAPLTNVLGSWEADGIELRNKARTTRMTINDSEAQMVSGTTVLTVSSGGVATLTAPTSLTIDTPSASFTGDISADGNISAGGNITAVGDVSADG